jgi:hypothetical protein
MAMMDPYQQMQQAQIDPMQAVGQSGVMNAVMPQQALTQQQQPEPPSTPEMLDQLIQDTIQDTTLNKDVQAKIILTLAQAIETLAKPELEMIKLQQPPAQPSK